MKIKIDLLRVPTEADWMRCKMLACGTMGKKAINQPDMDWMREMLECEHSPIRTLMFTIRMEIPYWVSVHYVRHKYGVEHYVQSQRNDRQDKYDRNAARQDETVIHIMDVNAQELIFMARKRLCGKAATETRQVMQEIVSMIEYACPEFEGMFKPECAYRGGVCHEMVPCEDVILWRD